MNLEFSVNPKVVKGINSFYILLKENSVLKQTVNTKRKTLKIVPYAAGLRRFELRMRVARPRLMTAVHCGCC